MIITIPLEDRSEEAQKHFLTSEYSANSDYIFDPYTAFSYDALENSFDEFSFTVSGSLFGESGDGSWTESVGYHCVNDDKFYFITNTNLQDVCEVLFPNVFADPESDQFFAYTKTEVDAKQLTAFLNSPDAIELFYIYGDLVESSL